MEDLQLDEILSDSFLDEQYEAKSFTRYSKPPSAYNKLQLEDWLALGFSIAWKEPLKEQY